MHCPRPRQGFCASAFAWRSRREFDLPAAASANERDVVVSGVPGEDGHGWGRSEAAERTLGFAGGAGVGDGAGAAGEVTQRNT